MRITRHRFQPLLFAGSRPRATTRSATGSSLTRLSGAFRCGSAMRRGVSNATDATPSLGRHQQNQGTLEAFFVHMGKTTEGFSDRIRTVSSGIWRPYLDIVAGCASKALNILDRFHVIQMFSRALDKTRPEEAAHLKELFQKLWEEEDTGDAQLFLEQWIYAATASRTSQMSRVAERYNDIANFY